MYTPSPGRKRVTRCTSPRADICRLRSLEPFLRSSEYSVSSTSTACRSPSRSITSSASFAVVTPTKLMPSGLSSERAAAFRPLTNSRSTRFSSLMTRMRLTGFTAAAPYNRPHARGRDLRIRHSGSDEGRQALPAQRLGGAPLRRDVRVRGRSPDAVLAVRASGHGERRALRGGGCSTGRDRADGLPVPAQLRQGQRAARARRTGRGTHQARRAAACGRYGLGYRRSYFSPLTACARRLLCRAPALRCRMPFATTRSIALCVSCISFSAAPLLPAASAFFTSLIALRTRVRRLMLWSRLTSACLARLRTDLMLAMD